MGPNEPVTEVGGLVDDSSVCLAVYGPELDPDEVTSRVGCQPSQAHRRGDQRSPQSLPFDKGAWLLELRGKSPTGPEQLIRRLLLRLPTDERVWNELASRFDIQLRIAVHFGGWNKGFDLPADIVAAISCMRASVVMDLYAYAEEDA